MQVLFCGVRGSTPAPGADFVRVGGNTSCVALTPSGASTPRLVLDAGTGLAALSRRLDHRPFRGTILLSHLHWDHTQGLPFFRAGDQPGSEVDLLLPDPQDGTTAVDLLARSMAPPHFPIRPEGLQGAWTFTAIDEGVHEVEGCTVHAVELPHKGGRTFGYRVEDPSGATVAYAPDHGPFALGAGPDGHGLVHDAVLALATGVDVLIHDAQFLADEAGVAEAYGHATVDYCFALAAAADVGHLVLFHHGPGRVDGDVEALAERAPAGLSVSVAREGDSLVR